MNIINLSSICNETEYRIFKKMCQDKNITLKHGIRLLIRQACEQGNLPMEFDYEDTENFYKEEILDKNKDLIIPIEKFIELVESGSIIANDGTGYISDGEYMYYKIICDISWLKEQKNRFTHVIWFANENQL